MPSFLRMDNAVAVGHRVRNWVVGEPTGASFANQIYYELHCTECARVRKYRARAINQGTVPACRHRDRRTAGRSR